jgi:chorismate synthase
MASNSFGEIFRMTTFGESHGPAIGAVLDGCPAGLSISIEEINRELSLRRPGHSPFTSPRKESDSVEILSGIFEGKTTGAPIALLIRNHDADTSQYDTLKNLYRPGHANFTYLAKYGLFDYRGGGRSSGRETAARVAVGAIAKKLLAHFSIECVAYLEQLGSLSIPMPDLSDLLLLRQKTLLSPIFCPDSISEALFIQKLEEIKKEKNSIGAVIACAARVPTSLGDPIYSKLEAKLASAMLSIPASKGFEIGDGFAAAHMLGSEHNDPFDIDDTGTIHTTTNHSGGTLGGISTGSPLYFRTAFKPTSSIKKPQETVTLQKKTTTLQLPDSARHDPCVAIRAVPVVEAMTALVLADALLMNRSSKIFDLQEIKAIW